MFGALRLGVFAWVLVGAAAFAHAQSYDPYEGDSGYGSYEGYDGRPTRNGGILRNQVDLELVGFIRSTLSFRYERVITRHLSLAIHPAWWWGNNETSSFDWALALQMRWYPEGHAMHGWYLSPQVGYVQVSGIDPFGFEATDRGVTYELLAGYNWIIAHAFSLYFAIGVGYTNGSNNLDDSYWHNYPLYTLGPFPVAEFGIGIPF